jgi:hypothetical protein
MEFSLRFKIAEEPVPVLPASLLDPLWNQFATHLPVRPDVDPVHPWGCHRRRLPDRVVVDLVIAALVHGSGLERIAVPGCSDRTIRRRLHAWAEAGIGHDVFTATLAAYDTMIGLDLADVSVDGSITKAVGGGSVWAAAPLTAASAARSVRSWSMPQAFPCMSRSPARTVTTHPC